MWFLMNANTANVSTLIAFWQLQMVRNCWAHFLYRMKKWKMINYPLANWPDILGAGIGIFHVQLHCDSCRNWQNYFPIPHGQLNYNVADCRLLGIQFSPRPARKTSGKRASKTNRAGDGGRGRENWGVGAVGLFEKSVQHVGQPNWRRLKLCSTPWITERIRSLAFFAVSAVRKNIQSLTTHY